MHLNKQSICVSNLVIYTHKKITLVHCKVIDDHSDGLEGEGVERGQGGGRGPLTTHLFHFLSSSRFQL